MNVISGVIATATRACPMTEILVPTPQSSSASRSKVAIEFNSYLRVGVSGFKREAPCQITAPRRMRELPIRYWSC